MIIANMSMSLDGFVADTADNPAQVFGWFTNGDVETPTATPAFSFKTSAATAKHLREAISMNGALVCGRRYFDEAVWAGTWTTHPMGNLPLFVVTHSMPEGWPKEEENVTFVHDGVKSAIAQAKAAAGDKNVAIATPDIAQQCLNLGLLDELSVELVPVLLGAGVPFFANLKNTPVALANPIVVEGDGVTHLRYRLARPI